VKKKREKHEMRREREELPCVGSFFARLYRVLDF
jgi:hypothetical protein